MMVDGRIYNDLCIVQFVISLNEQFVWSLYFYNVQVVEAQLYNTYIKCVRCIVWRIDNAYRRWGYLFLNKNDRVCKMLIQFIIIIYFSLRLYSRGLLEGYISDVVLSD